MKAFSADLKPIYKAVSEESALLALDEFEAKWGAKYPLGVKSLRSNWSEISTMFKYPKTKGTFVSDDAFFMKILYLVTMKITDKWTMSIRHWGTILNHLMIYFVDRVQIEF